MNFYTRNRSGSWVIIILVILNIILLATIWYPRLKSPEKKKQPQEIKQTDVDKTYRPEDENKETRAKRLTGFLQKELNFTQDQVDTFMRLREEHFQKADRNRRQSDDLRRELMELLLDDQLDSSRVEELAEKIGKRVAEHEKTVFYHFVELMKVCDLEQRPKYKTLLREILNQLRPPDHQPPGERPRNPRRRPAGIERGQDNQPGTRNREIDSPRQDRREPPPGIQDQEMTSPRQDRRGPPPRDERGGQGHAERFFRLLRDRLQLTASQEKKIRPLIESAHKQLEKIPRDSRYRTHEERRQAMNRVNRRLDSEIEILLTDRQKKQYAEIKKERDQHRPPPPDPTCVGERSGYNNQM